MNLRFKRSKSCLKVLVTAARYLAAARTHQPSEQTPASAAKVRVKGLVLEKSRVLGKRQGPRVGWMYKSVSARARAQKPRKNKAILMKIPGRAVEADLTFQTIKSRALSAAFLCPSDNGI